METTFAENLGSDNAQEALREREEINHLNEVFGYTKPSILKNLRKLLPQFLATVTPEPVKTSEDLSKEAEAKKADDKAHKVKDSQKADINFSSQGHEADQRRAKN